MSAPKVYDFQASDGVGLRLTRYQGGRKGPVILSPGFGTSGQAYCLDTVDTNLPEYLFAKNYDVWIFDYRASPALPSAATQFTLDDIAARDYPAAVKLVREVSRAESVQFMAHCVGSLTFLLAMTQGLEGVRSAVSSALTLHPVAPLINRVKARFRLATALAAVGMGTLTTDVHANAHFGERAFDRLLRFYPSHDGCSSPFCRRVLFLYGEVYDHSKLNPSTHQALPEVFGVANLTTFKQISRMLNKGHAVSSDGREIYLPEAARLRVPIAFIHGENNRLFLPRGSQQTFDYLCKINGPEYYVRHVIPDYAHMDCFVGKDADRDVFPIVLAELDKHNPVG
jgi:cholesterol oxidase